MNAKIKNQAAASLTIIDALPARPVSNLFSARSPEERACEAAIHGARNGAAENALVSLMTEEVIDLVRKTYGFPREKIVDALSCRGKYGQETLHALLVSVGTSCEDFLRMLAA